MSIMLKVYEKLQSQQKNTSHLGGDQIHPIILSFKCGQISEKKLIDLIIIVSSQKRKIHILLHCKYTKVIEGVKTSIECSRGKKLRFKSAFMIWVVLLLIMMPIVSATDTQRSNYIHIESVIMTFEGSNMNVTVKYKLDLFAKFYILLFGTKSIEPKLEGIFAEFENVEIKNVSQDSAEIVAVDVLIQEGETYHIRQHKLGQEVDKLLITFPDNHTITFDDINTLPSITYSY